MQLVTKAETVKFLVYGWGMKGGHLPQVHSILIALSHTLHVFRHEARSGFSHILRKAVHGLIDFTFFLFPHPKTIDTTLGSLLFASWRALLY